MDFVSVAYKENNDGTREFYPSFLAIESQDLVIRGGQFVAIWDEDKQLYNRRISHVPSIIDKAVAKMVQGELRSGDVVKKVRNFNNQIFNRVLSLFRSIGDMGPELDQTLVFADQQPTKADAATFKMPYSLQDGPTPAWDEITKVLYDEDERLKFEWAIGSILSGDAATQIQKFYVFFGPPGSGKSTIMNIIEWIFAGHTATFSAFKLGKADEAFSLEPFRNNPLVAIDQDADLSRLEVNINLNSITSHDSVLINAKGKSLYEIIPRATCFIGSNDPVKIRDRKSGLFRRLVDIQPTGELIPEDRYHELMAQVKFELGEIAARCLGVYRDRGPTYLSSYRSTEMMYRTNDIFNFVEDNRLILSQGVSLKQAHKMYVEWCTETDTKNIYKQFQFRDLLKDYYKNFYEEHMVHGTRHRSYFENLRELEKFSFKGLVPKPTREWLEMEPVPSLLDEVLKDEKAQYATSNSIYPLKKAWDECTSTLKDLDTSKEHYVKVPTHHIVIDFDLVDDAGEKSLVACLEAAALWPPTYAEPSRSGNGLHLHYDYDGDVASLAPVHSPGVEVKTLLGGASLRRRHASNNQHAISTISSGLEHQEPKVLSDSTVQTEKGLRASILKGLRKEVHNYTKPSMDFIKMVTDKAYAGGLVYDISDMFDDILAFAMGSSNQKGACIDIALALKLKSEVDVDSGPAEDAPLAYFDCEVYPNLFVIGYMYDRDDAEVVVMVNPTAAEVEELFKLRLCGWNNRGYDNHILWAASMGFSNEELFQLSQRIIVHNDRKGMFGAAYNVAYADYYELASTPNKKSLKAWEIILGLPHMEMDLPWDQPVPENRRMDVYNYLKNDVRSLRAVAKHLDADFRARQMLAELSGLEVCNTNRQHTEKLIFGQMSRDANPDLEYTDLREMFPGYVFDPFKPGKEKSTYKGYSIGEGGWVKSKPGMYYNVGVVDVTSMHPTSIVEMNMFGPHTAKFKELLDARIAIKNGDYDLAGQLYEGRLSPYLGDKASAKALSDALKVVINSVYGFTAATFPNQFKDDRNQDNIVAKRGALFMVDLVEYVESEGYEVIHVKTDSIKIPNITAEIVEKVKVFGSKYGYNFEFNEDTDLYERFCLVNDSTFVEYHKGQWSATGAQFLHPVVFKTLFSKEELEARDYIEVKQVSKGHMYLVSEVSGVKQFVGRFGAFVPVIGGKLLLRIDGDKEGAVTGTKGHGWELDTVALANEMDVDFSYFQNLIDKGRETIAKFGDYAEFTRP